MEKQSGRLLIGRIKTFTNGVLGEEHCGFRKLRVCVDQLLVVRQLCEKFLADGKDLFWAFRDIKSCNRADRGGLWQVFQLDGVGSKQLKAAPSFYVDNKACFRIGNVVSEWFAANVGVAASTPN